MKGRSSHCNAVLVAAMSLLTALVVTAGAASAEQRIVATAFPARSIAALARPLPRMEHGASSSALLSPQTPPGNFPFQTATSSDGLIVVHYYGQPELFAQTLISHAQADLAHPIHDTLGYSLKRPVQIYVYGSRGDFLTGAPVTNPAETGALAMPDTNSIYIQSSDPKDEGTVDDLPHELTHIVFHQNEDVDAFQQTFFEFFPHWLDEGLATYDEPPGDHNAADYDRAVTDAVQGRQMLDLLQQFNLNYPAETDADFLAYAEARSFIMYLVETYGADTFHRFLDGARDGDLLLSAENAFGTDLPVLQNRWEESLGVQLGPGARIGYNSALPPTISFHPGALPAAASQTHPVPLDPRAAIPAPVLIILALLLALTLSELGALWLATRVPRAQNTPPAAALAPLTSDNQVQNSGLIPWQPGISYLPAGEDPANPPLSSAGAAQVASEPIAVTLPAAPPTKAMPRSLIRWFDLPLVLLPLPLALLAGGLTVWLDPAHEWRAGYLAAACATAPVALAQLWNVARRPRLCPRFRMLGLVLAVLVVGESLLQAGAAGQAQAKAYESRGAYALALRSFAATGESPAQLESDSFRVHVEWAQAAIGVFDYATATTQLRAAILLDPTADLATQQLHVLSKVTLDWGQALVGSGQYEQAIRVYTDEAASATCDSACRAQLRTMAANAYVTWANALLKSGDSTGALAKLQVVTQSYAGTPSAQEAALGLREVPAQQALEAALSAGARGNTAGLDTQLGSVIARYPGTAAATVASETPQPVTGEIADSSGAQVAGDHLYFLPFASHAQAASFTYDFRKDPTPFKVVTTIGANGAFATRLPPGYWYVVCWHDPSQPAASDFNEPLYAGNEAFAVTALQPVNVGVILGY